VPPWRRRCPPATRCPSTSVGSGGSWSVPETRRGRKHDLGLRSVPCTAEELAKYDAVLISTPHAAFKDAALYRDAKLVVDTRNIVPATAARVLVRA